MIEDEILLKTEIMTYVQKDRFKISDTSALTDSKMTKDAGKLLLLGKQN